MEALEGIGSHGPVSGMLLLGVMPWAHPWAHPRTHTCALNFQVSPVVGLQLSSLFPVALSIQGPPGLFPSAQALLLFQSGQALWGGS